MTMLNPGLPTVVAIEGSTAVLNTQIDEISTASVTYVGKAAIGSATSSGVWQVMKIDESGSPINMVIKWAGGGQFTQVWDNRTSLTYS